MSNMTMTVDEKASYYVRYHIPYSQVWAGSGGGQHGNVHLHVPCPAEYSQRQQTVLTATTGRATTITRKPGTTLCGKNGGWMEREPSQWEATDDRCPRCASMADRYGVTWP